MTALEVCGSAAGGGGAVHRRRWQVVVSVRLAVVISGWKCWRVNSLTFLIGRISALFHTSRGQVSCQDPTGVHWSILLDTHSTCTCNTRSVDRMSYLNLVHRLAE